MKDLITVVLLLVIAFLVWNNRQSAKSTYAAEVAAQTGDRVSPDVTQVIIDAIIATKDDYRPLETLFINHQGEGVYNSRFMFLNTKNYYGEQIDVQARVNQNGSVDILNQTPTAKVDYSKSYKPDRYESWETVQNALDAQLKDALSKPVMVPPLESYQR
jgi:hypothetical protein